MDRSSTRLLPSMPLIVSQWSEPRRLSEVDDNSDTIEYAVTRVANGIRLMYVFVFVRADDGRWLIESM